MAQLITSNRNSPKRSHSPIRLDFTPMVDLGFLLITFFMLTTSLMEKKALELQMPARDTTASAETKASKVLTLLLDAPGKVYYYHGVFEGKIDSADFSAQGIRQVILEKKRAVEAKWGAGETILLIKPGEHCLYQDVVNALDEMSICGIGRKVLMEWSGEEQGMLKQER